MLDALVAEARLRWGLKPEQGLQIVPAQMLTAFPIEPTRPLLVVPVAVLQGTRGMPAPGSEPGRDEATAAGAPLPGRHGHGASPTALLRRLYPDAHVVGRLGVAEPMTVADLDESAFDGALYLAPVSPEGAPATPWTLPWLADRLRAPDGCPWDREQTHLSLRKHLLEEAYETYDAIESGATPELAGELGDLLLQIVLHAQLAAEEGVFDLTDVYESIDRKIVRRHPHVFGEAEAKTASDVNRQWEQIKRAEREAAAEGAADSEEPAPIRSALDGISRAMPALASTQEMQERAANLGYDWPDVSGVIAKVHEELAELAAATTPEEKREEMGDLLLVAVNLARKEGVDAEPALRAAAEKFRRRFRIVERLALEREVMLRDLTFEQLDELWDLAKIEERAALAAAGAPGADASDSGNTMVGPATEETR